MQEVVHVPTRELAKEVLRVAKENGFKEPSSELEHYFKIKGEELCFRFNEVVFSFGDKGFYKEEGYTIITAEEFLSRYEKEEVNELDRLRKENAELKKHYNNVENELKQLNNELSKELGLVKQQLKAIQDQPKVGDVCLFWDERYMTGFYVDILIKVMDNSHYKYRVRNGSYANCIKATDENIKAKIKELQDE